MCGAPRGGVRVSRGVPCKLAAVLHASYLEVPDCVPPAAKGGFAHGAQVHRVVHVAAARLVARGCVAQVAYRGSEHALRSRATAAHTHPTGRPPREALVGHQPRRAWSQPTARQRCPNSCSSGGVTTAARGRSSLQQHRRSGTLLAGCAAVQRAAARPRQGRPGARHPLLRAPRAALAPTPACRPTTLPSQREGVDAAASTRKPGSSSVPRRAALARVCALIPARPSAAAQEGLRAVTAAALLTWTRGLGPSAARRKKGGAVQQN